MSKKLGSLNDDTLKTMVVLVVLTAWLIAVVVGLIYPERKIDGNITTMMGAVVGYFLVDKVVNGKNGKDDKK